MQLAAAAPTMTQLRSEFAALGDHAGQLGALARTATAVTPELLQTAKATLDIADAAAVTAVSFLGDQQLGPAARQAREGIEELLDLGDSARETLDAGFDPAAMLDLRRAAEGLTGISRMMLITINETAPRS